MRVWVLVTGSDWTGPMAVAKSVDATVWAIVLGPRRLADDVAAAGPDQVHWVDLPPGTPAEAYAGSLAAHAAEAAPEVLISSADPGARALLGAVAGRIGARLIPGMNSLAETDAGMLVCRWAAAGQTMQTLAVPRPVALIYGGDDVGLPSTPPVEPRPLALQPAPVRITRTESAGAPTGLDDAERVVAFGRGVRAKADVALVQGLADALGAELACSMPIADDLGWLEKARYVGRSGQHISPRLYLAIGIAGAPQHLEGVRGARVVAAVNNDPDARIFRTADYGIVGDLYQVVPALISAINEQPGSQSQSGEPT